MSPDFDRMHPNPITSDQEPRDPRLEEVIQKLSESAKKLRDPRLLSSSSKPEESPLAIEYISDDRMNFVGLYGIHYGIAYRNRPNEEPARSRLLPREIQEYERLIPISVHKGNKRLYGFGDNNNLSFVSVWLNLDPRDPKVFQVIDDPQTPNTIVAIERPDLLPRIINAVSGIKKE